MLCPSIYYFFVFMLFRYNDIRSHSMQDYRGRGHTMSGNTQVTSIGRHKYNMLIKN